MLRSVQEKVSYVMWDLASIWESSLWYKIFHPYPREEGKLERERHDLSEEMKLITSLRTMISLRELSLP